MQDPHFLEVEARREIEQTSSESFDRIAFAMRALRLLRPDMTVAVYPRSHSMEVHRGRDLSRSADAAWAMVGVPPNASREHIALTIADLAGPPSASFLVDLLVSAEASEAPPD